MTTPTQDNTFSRNIMILVFLVIIVVGGAWMFNRQDHRTAGEKVGDAIDATPHAVSRAADELSDSSPIAKTGDALSKAGESASSAVSVAGEKAAAAMSETSADIKAAVDKQKQQDKAGDSKSSNE